MGGGTKVWVGVAYLCMATPLITSIEVICPGHIRVGSGSNPLALTQAPNKGPLVGFATNIETAPPQLSLSALLRPRLASLARFLEKLLCSSSQTWPRRERQNSSMRNWCFPSS